MSPISAREKIMHWSISILSQVSLLELAICIYQFLHPGTMLGQDRKL
jgi:hypothetical protein